MKALGILIAFFIAVSFVSAIDTFTVNSVIVKISLSQGEKVTKNLGINAINDGSFELSLDGLSAVSLSTKTFSLKAGEQKNIGIDVDSSLLEPGVYVGHLSIKNAQEHINVPIVLEVESQDVFFDLNLDIPPQYGQISPGDRFVVQVKVFDLTGFKAAGSLGPSPVTLTYELKGLNGETINIETENIIVDRQAQLTKTFVMPEKIKEGEYFFTATARHKTSLGTASYFFVVKSPAIQSRSIFTSEFIAILAVFGLFLIIILAFIIYLVRDRNKLFSELYKYNSSEMKRHEDILRAQAKVLEERNVPREKIEKQVDMKLGAIKKSQEKRVDELKKLQKKGNTDEMKRKLAAWKRQGYSTVGLDQKLNGLSTKEMKKLMSSWKKKYKTEDYKNR